MILEKYGIILQSISYSDLELIRYWRNQDHVRMNMNFQEIISQETQINWYSNLNQQTNLYFIIIKGSEKIGVINLKDIDWKTKQAEAGIFIGEMSHLSTLSPMLATILIMEFSFEILKLNRLLAKIGETNIKAILFNEGIGYEKYHSKSIDGFSYYETTLFKFTNATKAIRTTLDKLNTTGFKIELSQAEKTMYGLSNLK